MRKTYLKNRLPESMSELDVFVRHQAVVEDPVDRLRSE